MAESRISVVLPVYNEAGNIAACLRGLGAALEAEEHEILVVYDFDEDTTLPAIEAMTDCPASVRLVKNEIGRGAANALRAGFAAAQGEAVVTTMADLSDPPELIPEMARAIRAGADVVSGSRYMEGGSQTGGPLLKRCMSQTASFLLNGVAGLTTLDATSNFRGYSKRFLSEVTIDSDAGFEIALELTVKAHLAGRTIDELPSSWTDRTDGESQFQLWKWLPNYLRWFRRAMLEPACVWGLLLALTLLTVLFAEPPFVHAAEQGRFAATSALVALYAAGAAIVLVLARRLRGRTTWADLVHPVLWLAAPAFGLTTGHVPLTLTSCAVLSTIALGFGVGASRLAAGLRAGTARLADQRSLGVIALGLLIWLTRTFWPRSTAGPALDASWEQGIGYALKHGFQWGEDIVFTFGPLGYLNNGRFDPDFFWAKALWWDIVFKGGLTIFFVQAILRVRGPLLRTVAVLAFVLPMQGHDAYFFLMIVAIGAWLLGRTDRATIGTVFGLVPLSIIAFVKFTPLVLSFACVGLVALVYARRRSLASGVMVLGTFGTSLCSVWMLAGQSPLNLPAYITSSLGIAGAYNEAMAVFGPALEVQLAVLVATLGGLVALLAACERPRTLERVALGVLVCMGLFLAGKAGFVRHGNNAITFFSFAACVTYLIPSVGVGASNPVISRMRITGSVLCTLFAVFGYHTALEHGVHSPNRLVGDWMARFSMNARTLWDLDGKHEELAAERAKLVIGNGLRRSKEVVGDETVDLIHSKQGVVFLSDMTWHPRPAFQGYYSYSEELQAANRAFLESDDAPRYLLYHSETLDGRVPTMDDAQAVLVMMRDYKPLLSERRYLLLERQDDAPRASTETVVDERTLTFAETYALPEEALASDGSSVYMLRIDVRPTLLGKLGTILAKPPTVTVYLKRHREERFKLVPGMGRAGFFVNPFPVGQTDWVHWFTGRSLLPVETARVEIGEHATSWYQPEVRYQLVRIDGIDPSAGALDLEFSSFTPPPSIVRTPRPARRRTVRGREYVIVRAPSELRFDVGRGSHVLSCGYGLDPRSYRREERTDGAGYSAVLIDDEGNETELWSNVLNPAEDIAHCELQELRLRFETDGPAQLALRTNGGPSGDAQHDLAFWYEVRIGPPN